MLLSIRDLSVKILTIMYKSQNLCTETIDSLNVWLINCKTVSHEIQCMLWSVTSNLSLSRSLSLSLLSNDNRLIDHYISEIEIILFKKLQILLCENHFDII